MRSILPLAASLVMVGAASPALAQDPDPALGKTAAAMADRMSDPAIQQELAFTLSTLSQVLLDLPIAPLAKAAADMAGENAPAVDPQMTLRKVAPKADKVPQVIERELPLAMEQMAGMAGGIEEMMPALRDFAQQMGLAFEGIEVR